MSLLKFQIHRMYTRKIDISLPVPVRWVGPAGRVQDPVRAEIWAKHKLQSQLQGQIRLYKSCKIHCVHLHRKTAPAHLSWCLAQNSTFRTRMPTVPCLRTGRWTTSPLEARGLLQCFFGKGFHFSGIPGFARTRAQATLRGQQTN